MRLKRVGMIERDKNVYPIINEDELEPGRYAIKVDEFTHGISVLERGNINDGTSLYYCKQIKTYNDNSVYLYTNNMYESTRKKFSVNKLLRNAVVCNMI